MTSSFTSIHRLLLPSLLSLAVTAGACSSMSLGRDDRDGAGPGATTPADAGSFGSQPPRPDAPAAVTPPFGSPPDAAVGPFPGPPSDGGAFGGAPSDAGGFGPPSPPSDAGGFGPPSPPSDAGGPGAPFPPSDAGGFVPPPSPGLCGGEACGAGNFCDKTCGAPDSQGKCRARPALCPAIVLPVPQICGCDGKTYKDDCDRINAYVLKAHDGPCTPTPGPVSACGGATCASGEFCDKPCGAPDSQGKCAARSGGFGCAAVVVCGCDGQSYGSGCAAREAGVSVSHLGPCP